MKQFKQLVTGFVILSFVAVTPAATYAQPGEKPVRYAVEGHEQDLIFQLIESHMDLEVEKNNLETLNQFIDALESESAFEKFLNVNSVIGVFTALATFYFFKKAKAKGDLRTLFYGFVGILTGGVSISAFYASIKEVFNPQTKLGSLKDLKTQLTEKKAALTAQAALVKEKLDEIIAKLRAKGVPAEKIYEKVAKEVEASSSILGEVSQTEVRAFEIQEDLDQNSAALVGSLIALLGVTFQKGSKSKKAKAVLMLPFAVSLVYLAFERKAKKSELKELERMVEELRFNYRSIILTEVRSHLEFEQ